MTRIPSPLLWSPCILNLRDSRPIVIAIQSLSPCPNCKIDFCLIKQGSKSIIWQPLNCFNKELYVSRCCLNFILARQIHQSCSAPQQALCGEAKIVSFVLGKSNFVEHRSPSIPSNRAAANTGKFTGCIAASDCMDSWICKPPFLEHSSVGSACIYGLILSCYPICRARSSPIVSNGKKQC